MDAWRIRGNGVLMGTAARSALLALVMLAAACTSSPPSPPAPPTTGETPREMARRHVNRGVAYLSQFLPGKAMEEFQAAVALDPDNVAACVNLGIASRVSADLDSARTWLEKALALDPDNLTAHFNLALVDRATGDAAAAIAHLERVVALDPREAEALYVLGLTHAQLQQFDQAVADFDAALALSPTHASALYGKGRALMALGREEEALSAIERSQEISSGQLATTSGQQYGEQGRHSLAIEDMPSDPAAPPAAAVRYTVVDDPDLARAVQAGGPVEDGTPPIGSGAALVDLDGDSDLDLYLINAAPDGGAPNRLFHNRGDGTFEDVSAVSGLDDAGPGTGVTAGDYDNDGFVDLYVANWGGNHLFRNRGDATFEDVTARAGVASPGRSMGVAFGDADHDGDLDLVVAARDPGHGLVFFRNRGDGTFVEGTETSGFGGQPAATGVLFVDVDADRDIDVLVSGPGPLRLFLNNRDGTFTEQATELGLAGAVRSRGLATLDLHKDGLADLIVSGHQPGASVWTGARGVFRRQPPDLVAASAYGVAILDMDLDGFADLAVATGDEAPAVRLFRNEGRGRFSEITGAVGLAGAAAGGGRGLLAGDLDGDGDPELILTRVGAPPILLRNDTDTAARWVRVGLQGLHSNRSGIGSRVAVRAGDLWQSARLSAGGGYLTSGPLQTTFGLGARDSIDAVSVLWPGGVLQDELDVRPRQTLELKELDRKGSSCPTLFGWDGARFAFLSDFIGGGVLGLELAPGVTYQPDPEELHRVRPEVGLTPDDTGRVRLRLTDNLEEVTYVDEVHLQAVDHPAGTLVLPEEGLRPAPPYPAPALHLFDTVVDPVEASDGAGRDWLDAVRAVDRLYPRFALGQRLGHARPHELTVRFVAPSASGRLWLWAQGTLEFSNSTPNLAAAQEDTSPAWPALERRNGEGPFQVVTREMPVPMGIDKPVLVPLQAAPPGTAVTLRITTGLQIYWDRLSLVTEGDGGRMRVHRRHPAAATLRSGGFPLWISEDGRRPKTFRYDARQDLDSWKPIPGRYTRHGPVDPLVATADDLLVVMSPGDELALDFDLSDLPPPAAGWTRTWLVHGVGYVKDTDLNTPTAGQVAPLPFAAMGSFPPPASAYFADAARAASAARFNTRVVGAHDPLRRWPTGAAIDASGRAR
ncbi:MAG: FG-GAP-like repeat-containing protein [Acidobacteriota bacterium]